MAITRSIRPLLLVPVALIAVLQLVPLGRDHSAPADGAHPAWDSPRTLELARRACFDCHSHETRWPWYSHVAPISWRIEAHVKEGRGELDFSAFDTGNEKVTEAAGEAAETVREREMPPADYLLAHPEARLTPQESAELAAGLERTFAAWAESEGGQDGEGGEEGSTRPQPAVMPERSGRGHQEEESDRD